MYNKISFIRSLSPRLIKNKFLLVESYVKREPTIAGLPVELSIELTNHCNSDCIMCPRQKMSRKKGFMEFNLFKKIVDEAKDFVELAILHLAGEPLLHPELMRMIHYCGKIGLRTMFSTNAILLDELRAKELIKSPLNLLTLSFDAVTKNTYEKIRRISDFDIAYQNIQRFLSLKAKSKSAPYTVIQMIYLKENAQEAKDFLVKWQDSGANAVRIKPYFNYPGLDNYLGGVPRKMESPLKPCLLLWRQLTIYWDGTVVPCCQDFLSGKVIGDVNQDSIMDIWDDEGMIKMRQVHAQGGGHNLSLCKDCTIPQLSLTSFLGAVFFNALTIRKILPVLERWAILNNLHSLNYFV